MIKPRLCLLLAALLLCLSNSFGQTRLKNVNAFVVTDTLKLDVTASIYTFINHSESIKLIGQDTITAGTTLGLKLYYETFPIGSGFLKDILLTDTVNIGILNSNYDKITVEMYTVTQLDTAYYDTVFHPQPWTIFLPLNINSLNEIESAIHIYPNPNNGKFEIKSSLPQTTNQVEITIINALGQIVYHDEITIENGILHKAIDLTDIAAGAYVLRFHTDDGWNWTKFTLQ